MTVLNAKDLMTENVVTVPPETPVLAIARLLAERGISAVPVLAIDGTLAGIVTEADLIRRLTGSDGKPMSLLRQLFTDMDRLADRYAASHGATAADVMTRDVVTVAPTMPIPEIAEMMEKKGIRRVLVAHENHLLGIVSRADLLRALVEPPAETGEYSDDRLRRAVLATMRREPWADTFFTLVDVKDGVVELHGFSNSAAVLRGLKVLVAQVPGVKGVVDNTQPMPAQLFAAA